MVSRSTQTKQRRNAPLRSRRERLLDGARVARRSSGSATVIESRGSDQGSHWEKTEYRTARSHLGCRARHQRIYGVYYAVTFRSQLAFENHESNPNYVCFPNLREWLGGNRRPQSARFTRSHGR